MSFRKPRRASPTRSPKKPSNSKPYPPLTKLTLLRLVNPFKSGFIELDNMVSYNQKTILKRLPPNIQGVCHKIFHDYIFTHKTFVLPVDTFYQLYQKSQQSPVSQQTKRTKSKRSLRVSEIPSPSVIDEVKSEERSEYFASFDVMQNLQGMSTISPQSQTFDNSGPPTIFQSMCPDQNPDQPCFQSQDPQYLGAKEITINKIEAPRPVSVKKSRPKKLKGRLSTGSTKKSRPVLNQSVNKGQMNKSVRNFGQAPVFKNLRSLSRERTFIKYDQEFIGEMKETLEVRPSIFRSHTPKPTRKSIQEPQSQNNSSYKSIKKKRDEVRNSVYQKSPVRKGKPQQKSVQAGASFRGVYKDSLELIRIRQKHLKYSMRNQ